MDPRINIVTLGVDDLQRALRFYRDGLGWKPAMEVGDFVLFKLGALGLALYPRPLLAEDARLPPGRGGFGGITLAHNVASRERVDATLAQAVAAGATLLKPAQVAEWGGYSGYFADPDGHPWEVAHNPGFGLNPDGSIAVP